MADLQKVKSDALAVIDAALAILNKFPKLDTTNTDLSYNMSANPFDFLLDAFKNTAGYNILIKIISNFIIYAIPPMEIAIKAILLSNIKNLLSCSINPFISDELLREGIVFDLEQIDITDTLKYCPTTQKGQYYYFDNKNNDQSFKIPDELKDSTDFNCLLWFMKNKAIHREVWGMKRNPSNGNFNGLSDSDYWNADKEKCRKGAGIVTLQFNERSASITNAEGGGISVQTPFNNCLHVFLGNVQPWDGKNEDGRTRSSLENEILNLKRDISNRDIQINKNIETLRGFIEENKKYDKYLKQKKVSNEEYERKVICGENVLNDIIKIIEDRNVNFDKSGTNINDEEAKYLEKLKTETSNEEEYNKLITNYKPKVLDIISKSNVLFIQNREALDNVVAIEKEILSIPIKYRDITQNYYYRRTLIEFNYDYVMSLRLFDAKVISAQLIDNLVGLMNIDLNLSYKQQLIKNEVKKMIEAIVETDSTAVSDCFFAFTNDAYNDMLEKAELNRAKLFSTNGEFNNTNQINVEDVLSKLNDISDDASQEGNVSLIEHAITEISEEMSRTTAVEKDQFNIGINFNFIENLLNNLAYVIVNSVLSPKVYLLIMINLKILGEEMNFNLDEFIRKFKQMIIDIIRSIVNEIIKYLMEQLMKILTPLAVEISVKIGVEQAEYYARLLKKMIDCFKSKRTRLDFEIDNVQHADIISEEITEKNMEC